MKKSEKKILLNNKTRLERLELEKLDKSIKRLYVKLETENDLDIKLNIIQKMNIKMRRFRMIEMKQNNEYFFNKYGNPICRPISYGRTEGSLYFGNNLTCHLERTPQSQAPLSHQK